MVGDPSSSSSSSPPPAPPQLSLLRTLRSMPDDALAGLLHRRLDLAVPRPTDLAAVSRRARTAVSVSRALELLDEPTLRVLDGVRLAAGDEETASVDAVMALTKQPSEVPAALVRLRALALVWGPDTALSFPSTLAEAAGPYPAGLGRAAAELSEEAAELASDAAALRRTLMAASPQARAVLDRLAAGPPIGTVTDAYSQATMPAGGSATPVRWLIAHHLLVPVADDTVELPREVAVLLRRDTGPLGRLAPCPLPGMEGPGAKVVDSSAAATVLDVVGYTESILSSLADDPAPEIKSGGIGMQRLHRLARDTGLTDSHTALILELAFAAGLLGRGKGWMPSGGYDGWLAADSAVRWAKLAKVWLTTPRDARLLGARPGQNRPNTVLSDSMTSRLAPAWRREVLGVLAEQEKGVAVDPDLLGRILAWRHPRRQNGEVVRAVLDQAAFLGVTVADSITGPGRALLVKPDPDDPLGVNTSEFDPVVQALTEVLPQPVDDVVVQSDLTVIVPGPASVLLASELALVAEPESRAVHRVTESSLRRAMDAGYTAEDIHALFTRRARGELPQTLSYLIDDVARRYGGLRTGAAGAYLRSEDTAMIVQVLADRRLESLRLRRLAPTVVCSGYPLEDMVDILRRAGYAPVTEDAGGDIVVERSVSPRAPRTDRPDDAADTTVVDEAPLLALVEDLRFADAAAPDDDDEIGEEIHHVLRAAIPERQPVWIEYTDSRGQEIRRLLRPVSLRDGYLRAEDRRTDMLHTIAVHAIQAVHPATV